MADGIAFIQWNNFVSGVDACGFFSADPLVFSSRQDRLHKVDVGSRLWLVSRDPSNSQHYFVAVLKVEQHQRNEVGSPLADSYGEYSIVADRNGSIDLGQRFPADGLLRALKFESGKAIKFGASIGQSLQTIRLLSASDERVLNAALRRVDGGDAAALELPFGLWTKCDAVFANYFSKNWRANGQRLAFFLYDSPPILPNGAPVFIHSDKNLRLLASFRGSQYVTGYKPTADANERIAERERIWNTFRAPTIDPPTKAEFDEFWDSQHGVRALFLMDNLIDIPAELQFKTYGRALEWGYPMGVGYRYLTLSQCLLLLHASAVSEEVRDSFMAPLLTNAVVA
jgi:hypothetical protein